MTRPLAISVGDPAGVGPAVSVRALAGVLGDDRAVLFGDAERLATDAQGVGLEVRAVDRARVSELSAGEVGVVHVASWTDAMIEARAPTPEGGAAQKQALDAAISAVSAGDCRALVTGPVSKEAISAAGERFLGHTEHLAAAAGLADDAVTMMFLGPRLRVALATTHWAIADVPAQVTRARVARATTHLGEALRRWTDKRPLRIAVCGLNPHAGEGGLLGSEEQERIGPAIEDARQRLDDSAVVLEGPTPAEAAFRFAAAGEVDGVVGMYHDQATIASKLLDWGEAVNVTWGLPFVRTSVDHGVAYDAAKDNAAEDSGMRAAIVAAQKLSDGG